MHPATRYGSAGAAKSLSATHGLIDLGSGSPSPGCDRATPGPTPALLTAARIDAPELSDYAELCA